MLIKSDPLIRFTAAIVAKAGSEDAEARTIARRLVASNLVGHDSHGVVRVPLYLKMVDEGHQRWNQHVEVVFESDVLAILDGQRGFGQVIGEEAMALGIAKAKAKGIALVGLRNAGHLGRMGDWAEMAVEAGCASLHFLNTLGGPCVAPFGGREGRLSTNPITIGIPVAARTPIILDMTTSAVAQGKIVVARNKGEQVPEGWLIDKHGRPTRDPNDLFDGGALVPIAAHKGSGLSIVTDLLAGALVGGGSSGPDARYMVNNMMAIVIDPSVYGDAGGIGGEVARFVDWVRSSAPSTEGGEVLMPGEIEQQVKAKRSAEGIPIDDNSWSQIMDAAKAVGLEPAEIDHLLAS